MPSPDNPEDNEILTAPIGKIVGAVCMLKSMSPKMTVASVSGNKCLCRWYHDVRMEFVEKEFERDELVILWHSEQSVDDLINI